MKILLRSSVFFLLLSLCLCNIVEEFGSECRYKGDMGAVDPDCIRRMREQLVLVEECYGVYYGPGMLYKNRGDVLFWIGIDEDEQNYFPKGLTYTIYSKTGRYSEFGSLTRVEGCESVGINQACTLPKRKRGEKHVIYLPIKSRSAWFCEFFIEEYSGTPRFCNDDSEYGCIEIVDGKLQLRDILVPLTSTEYKPKFQACLFPVADSHLDSVARGKYANGVLNATKRGKSVRFQRPHGNDRCVEVKGSSGSNITQMADRSLSTRLRGNDGFCLFVKVPEISRKWIKTPVCYRSIST